MGAATKHTNSTRALRIWTDAPKLEIAPKGSPEPMLAETAHICPELAGRHLDTTPSKLRGGSVWQLEGSERLQEAHAT